MDLTRKDLNLLNIFSIVWEERNLSKAASRLFISQSAVSHSLKKLRSEFGDPLFVRDSHGVTPTEFAQKLAPKISHLLKQIEAMYSATNEFDPKKSKRDLILAAGDYFSVTKLENFVKIIAAEAPRVRLIVKPVASVFHLDKFETGEIHLAITAIEVPAKEGFHCQELQRDKIAICARKDHPHIKKNISAEKYLQAKHVNVSNFGSDRGVVDEFLLTQSQQRDVAIVVSSFYDAARLVRSTNMLLSAPKPICQGLADEFNLEVINFPFKESARSISLLWHERTNEDPFHVWARGLAIKA